MRDYLRFQLIFLGLMTGFTPAASDKALQSMRDKIKASNIKNRVYLSIQEIADYFNPILEGWINYYGRFTRSQLYKICSYFNCIIIKFLAKKYKFRRCKGKATNLLIKIRKRRPNLFAHWKHGMEGAFVV